MQVGFKLCYCIITSVLHPVLCPRQHVENIRPIKQQQKQTTTL